MCWVGNMKKCLNCPKNLIIKQFAHLILQTYFEDMPIIKKTEPLLEPVIRYMTTKSNKAYSGRTQDEYRNYIMNAIQNSPTIKDAARLLNIGERTLYRKIKEFNLQPVAHN